MRFYLFVLLSHFSHYSVIYRLRNVVGSRQEEESLLLPSLTCVMDSIKWVIKGLVARELTKCVEHTVRQIRIIKEASMVHRRGRSTEIRRCGRHGISRTFCSERRFVSPLVPTGVEKKRPSCYYLTD